VAESVAEYDGPARERRFDHLGHMLASGGEHEKGFGFGRHRFIGAIEQGGADFFRERRAARFPGFHGAVPLPAEVFSQESGLGGFSAPLDPLQGNEQTSWRLMASCHGLGLKSSGRKRAESYSK